MSCLHGFNGASCAGPYCGPCPHRPSGGGGPSGGSSSPRNSGGGGVAIGLSILALGLLAVAINSANDSDSSPRYERDDRGERTIPRRSVRQDPVPPGKVLIDGKLYGEEGLRDATWVFKNCPKTLWEDVNAGKPGHNARYRRIGIEWHDDCPYSSYERHYRR